MKNIQYIALGILTGYLAPYLIALIKAQTASEKEVSYSQDY